MDAVPFERAYWVEPGRLMAGAYPGDYALDEARRRLDGLLACGIRRFVSLMEAREESPEEREAPAYARLLGDLARRRRIEVDWRRHAIHDYSVPSLGEMDVILQTLDEAVGRGQPVYLHCWGGRGRTGTVVGAHLIRSGRATVEDFREVIAGLRQSDAGGGLSPENEAQVRFVRAWAARAAAAGR